MAKFRERLEQAKAHIRFCIKLYWYQLRNGRHFLHEHPWTARSWEMEEMQRLQAHPGVQLVQAHMCGFGMTAPEHGNCSQEGPVKKPTGFLTSSTCIAQALNRRCNQEHTHVHLMSGKAAGAQVYPVKLCEAILDGLIQQKKEDSLGRVSTGSMNRGGVASLIRDLCRGGGPEDASVQKAARSVMSMATTAGLSSTTMRPKGDWPKHWVDEMHEEDGGEDDRGIRPQRGVEILKREMHLLNCRNGIEYAEDDTNQQVLEPTLVKAARKVEMEYFEKLGVYERVDRSEQMSRCEREGKL